MYKGEDLLKKSPKEMRDIRGKEISMIFQEPMTSLNPVITVGKQIMEAVLTHEKMSKQEAKERALEMIKLVGIPMPEKVFASCPHQLSGGMRQRIMIAMAIMFVLGPGLINLYLALGLLGWASTARLIRGDVMRLKKMEYIDACKVSGGNSFRIIMKHLLPNCLSTLIVTVTLGIPNAIMSEASLSFLGLGVKAPMASWGSMISFSQPYIRSATYYSVIPGLAIIITVLAFNMLGDGLRDALDPKLRS